MVNITFKNYISKISSSKYLSKKYNNGTFIFVHTFCFKIYAIIIFVTHIGPRIGSYYYHTPKTIEVTYGTWFHLEKEKEK